MRFGTAGFAACRHAGDGWAGTAPRLLESAVTFVLVTIVVFLGVRALPATRPGRWPARRATRPRWRDPARVRAGPAAPVQYVRYVGNALHGDLGTSARTGLPVASSIGHASR
jgi:peptide/nickel transport system permease protein